ncbi:MAG TPA: thioredoxin domain-containing protein [Chthonomonadaceae bacterium]|nr:thioredoxin domain-containing protein [Chthonomonadaceae bacterium]
MAITLPVPPNPKDWQRGSAEAPVTLIEYGDFQCEDSAAAYPVIKRLLEDQGERLRFIFRHLPLTDIHIHALDAAKAAEAAGALGRFWEMHDALYEHSPRLNRPDLRRYAEEIGLEGERFEQELANPQAYAGVREDVDGIRPTGIGSTPTFFINGEHYEGPATLEALAEAIARAAG